MRMDYRLQSPYCGGALKISSQQKGEHMKDKVKQKVYASFFKDL